MDFDCIDIKKLAVQIDHKKRWQYPQESDLDLEVFQDCSNIDLIRKMNGHPNNTASIIAIK
jgi:hypothetical protein